MFNIASAFLPDPVPAWRQLRLEFPGACQQVLNRGNDRAQVFAIEQTRAAFEACVWEAMLQIKNPFVSFGVDAAIKLS